MSYIFGKISGVYELIVLELFFVHIHNMWTIS